MRTSELLTALVPSAVLTMLANCTEAKKHQAWEVEKLSGLPWTLVYCCSNPMHGLIGRLTESIVLSGMSCAAGVREETISKCESQNRLSSMHEPSICLGKNFLLI